ncbi:MAG: ribbon-helix-helix protein, CopG family [Planctomycetes bacterium]|nr:ribbon-helix-helix protein, CopG family [Planctomycetota bacterium]
MDSAKVAISINKETLEKLDNLVKEQVFANRSRAIQEAVEEKLNRMQRTRLAEQCAKLDPAHEQQLAEEGLSAELNKWPVY